MTDRVPPVDEGGTGGPVVVAMGIIGPSLRRN